MVAVRHVERFDRLEGGGESVDGRLVGDGPELVAHPIGGGEVHLGRRRAHPRQHLVDGLGGPVDQEHGPGLGVQGVDLTHPVVLLHRAGELVLLDAIRVIGRHRGGRHQTGLGVIAHGEAIDVIARGGVADQHPLGEHVVEVLPRPWRRPPGHRGRCPPAGRPRGGRCAGSSRAGRRPWREPPRRSSRHRAGRRPRPHARGRA